MDAVRKAHQAAFGRGTFVVVGRSAESLDVMSSLYLGAVEAELLGHLNASGARYMVIGGHAVSFHGYPRTMKDLDVWVEPTTENAAKVARALSAMGANLGLAEIERLSRPKLKMPIARRYTEILTSCEGLDFDAAFTNVMIVFEFGVPCPVISKADLIASKKALGRDNDLDDVAHLERT